MININRVNHTTPTEPVHVKTRPQLTNAKTLLQKASTLVEGSDYLTLDERVAII